MTKILFICHGNICRSPMAEFIFKTLAKKAGRGAEFQVASAAVSAEEIGNPVYPPAARKLAQSGISCRGKAARQVTRRDFETYDLLIGMDRSNLRRMRGMCPAGLEGKLSLLMDWTDRPGDVDDPWYSGDFDAAYSDILAGCTALLAQLP